MCDGLEVDMGNDEPDVISVVPLDDADTAARTARPWLRNAASAMTALVSIVALSLGVGALTAQRSRDEGSDPATTDSDLLVTSAARAVLAALDASTSTGGYEVSYEFVIEPPATDPARCNGQEAFTVDGGFAATSVAAPVEACPYDAPVITVTGNGIVHLNPYFLEVTSNLSNLGEVTVRTDGNRIVEEGGANYGGSLESGQPLSGFASLVEGAFGRGPGALTMLALASPTGYLSLSAETVTDVAPAGTGDVNGVPVTFYDVISDTAAMRDLPGLTSEQLQTIDDALAVLGQTGSAEASARIAVDADGYIRESTSVASFADGTTMTRHMNLSRFGCVGTAPTPANPNGNYEDLPPECANPSTSTTASPAPPPSTVIAATTSSSTATPSTTVTAAPTTTIAAASTTTTPPTTTTIAATSTTTTTL